MHFFGMIFWLVVLWFAFRALRRRERWAVMGPRGYAPWWYSGGRYGPPATSASRSPESRGEDREDYMEALETRVTNLEERLDFTERLLAGRREPETDK